MKKKSKIKFYFKKILTISLILFFIFLVSSCDTRRDKPKILNVVISSGYKPYEMINSDGEFYGFDIELINKLAEITGYKIKINDVSFDGIIDMIKNHQADLAISGITFTEERNKQVDFSKPYYFSQDTCYIVFKNSLRINKMSDLFNKKIGAQIGSMQEQTSEELIKKYKVKVERLTNYADLLQQLDRNIIDAIVVEKEVALEFSKENQNLNYFKLIVDTKLGGNCIVFAKKSPLKKEFDVAIEKLENNGFLNNLINKYFS